MKNSINGVKIKENWDGVSVVSICSWIDVYDPNRKIPYMERGKILSDWCDKNNAHYYARPKEWFFIYEAVSEAVNASFCDIGEAYILMQEAYKMLKQEKIASEKQIEKAIDEVKNEIICNR